MLDEICSFLLLPFYATWKVLLGYNFERKKLQEKILPLVHFLALTIYFNFFLDVSSFILKIMFGVLIFITLIPLSISHSRKIILKKFEGDHLKDKWYIYRKSVLNVIIFFITLIHFKYSPLFFMALNQMFLLFLFVGFEFPDEPPKKKEERQNGSWLAKLMAPKPLTNT